MTSQAQTSLQQRGAESRLQVCQVKLLEGNINRWSNDAEMMVLMVSSRFSVGFGH